MVKLLILLVLLPVLDPLTALEPPDSQNARLLKSTQFAQSAPIEGTLWVFTCPVDVAARRPSLDAIVAAEVDVDEREDGRVRDREAREHQQPRWSEEFQIAPLPGGWEMRMATSGRPYFVDNECVLLRGL